MHALAVHARVGNLSSAVLCTRVTREKLIKRYDCALQYVYIIFDYQLSIPVNANWSIAKLLINKLIYTEETINILSHNKLNSRVFMPQLFNGSIFLREYINN